MGTSCRAWGWGAGGPARRGHRAGGEGRGREAGTGANARPSFRRRRRTATSGGRPCLHRRLRRLRRRLRRRRREGGGARTGRGGASRHRSSSGSRPPPPPPPPPPRPPPTAPSSRPSSADSGCGRAASSVWPSSTDDRAVSLRQQHSSRAGESHHSYAKLLKLRAHPQPTLYTTCSVHSRANLDFWMDAIGRAVYF